MDARTRGRFPEMPEVSHHRDLVVIDFGFDPTLHGRGRSKHRQKIVKSVVGTVFNDWCTTGAVVLARFSLSDVYGMAAADETTHSAFDRLNFGTALPQPNGHQVTAWQRRADVKEMRRLKQRPWIKVSRLNDGTHHIEDSKGNVLLSACESHMQGILARRRAAMYSAVTDALEGAQRRGEKSIAILHCGDLQPQFFSDQWKPRASYLAEPIERLRHRLRSFHRVDFIPMSNDGRCYWAMSRTLQ
jgi:hypothetical protein